MKKIKENAAPINEAELKNVTGGVHHLPSPEDEQVIAMRKQSNLTAPDTNRPCDPPEIDPPQKFNNTID